MHLALLLSGLLVLASAAPQRSRNINPNTRNRNSNPNTRFFTGNQAIDAAAWGAVGGAATQYFSNQVLNPCRGGTRGTNNRIFANTAVDNGILGFLGGFAAAAVAHNAAGRPCG
jgi:hypothetical protein